MPKILNVALILALLIALSQFARTSTGIYRQGEQTAAVQQEQNQFSLKKSYLLRNENQDMLATIYSCGLGVKKKEILSIWSRETDAYELQYIRAAAGDQSFLEPFLFSVENKDFIRVSTRDRKTGGVATDSVLSLKSDSTLDEIELKRFKEMLKVNLRDIRESM